MVVRKAILDENQYVKWEDDGVPILVQIDPVTQKESIIISGGPPQEFVVIFEVEVDFAVGDSAVIVSGPFEGAQGIISAINMHKQSVTVNIEMLGRETPVEISFTDVRVENY